LSTLDFYPFSAHNVLSMASKIALIEPNAGLWQPGTFLRHSSIEPLAIEYIGAIAKAEGMTVKIIQQQAKSSQEVFDEVIDFSPHLIGFSVMTYNYPASLALVQKIKQHSSKIMTIFGGYHPSFFPEIVKEDAIDFVIIGEGEETFKELLKALNKKEQGYEKVKGLAYYNGEVQINEPRERIKDLDSLPNPLRDDNILKECRISGLNYPPLSKQKSVAQIQYSRGCPHNCIFCSSPFMFGSKVFYRNPEKVVREMQEIIEKYRTNYFYFADLSFNLNRQRIIALCSEIRKNKLNVNWFCMCRPDNLNKHTLQEMKEAGCSRIGFGIDALNDDTLKRIKPGQDISMEKTRDILKLVNSLGIIVRTFVIIGYPWESKKDMNDSIEILKTLPIDELRIGLLTPLPGSTIYKRFKNLGIILTDDFSKYTTEEYIINHPEMDSDEMIAYRDRIFREFYQSSEYRRRTQAKLRKFPHLQQSYDEFFTFLKERKIIK
jgi:anaerobic magnesium-protoporphyrin IX monomethyl ester cyclase